MKIVIVGVGMVGLSICSQLAPEGHDITLVDTDVEVLKEVSARFDVFYVEGSGANISVLRKASADKADLLIAVTSGDEINILCCSAAKMLGTKHTIARVRNPEYGELIHLMKNETNLSLTINPELSVAKEMCRMLRYPSATKIDFFCRGRVELAELVVSADSPMCGITLNDLRSKLNMRFLVCAVLRGGAAYIPSGVFCIEAGDVICITAPDRELTRIFKALGIYKQPVRDVLVVGGSRTSFYLAAMLETHKINATIIEKNKAICREFAEQYDCNVVCADGSKQEVLLEQGIDHADAFLALSDSDEENAIVSMYAKALNVPKVITMIGRIPYIELFKNIGLDSILSPNSSTASSIIHYIRSMTNVRGSEIESLHRLMEDKVEALEFLIKEEIVGLTGIPLKDLIFQKGVLIACIVHNDKVIIPSGDDVISNGDTVIVVTTVEQIKGIKEILK